VQAGPGVKLVVPNDDRGAGLVTHTSMAKTLAFFLGSLPTVSNSRPTNLFETLAFEFNLHADRFDVSAEVFFIHIYFYHTTRIWVFMFIYIYKCFQTTLGGTC
jgi:hypothetical protein